MPWPGAHLRDKLTGWAVGGNDVQAGCARRGGQVVEPQQVDLPQVQQPQVHRWERHDGADRVSRSVVWEVERSQAQAHGLA